MSQYDYDLFVIGGGSGGIRAARWSAQLGAKVALCEKDRMGGTCVIRGCIPKKLMVYVSAFNKNFKLAQDYGWEFKSSPQLNWKNFCETRDKELDRLEAIYTNILKTHKVDFIQGLGSLQDPHTVQVNGKNYTARYILIAVGGKPFSLPIEGAEHCISSNEVFHLDQIPSSLMVLGAGYIGLEFASLFKALGADVSVMFRKDLILSGFDKSVREHLQKELSSQGINMLSKREPIRITKQGNSLKLTDNQSQTWTGDVILMATGRTADLTGLNLDKVGLQTDKNHILVKDNFQTTCESIYAVGDCNNKPYQLTPVALSEGMFVSESLFGSKKENLKFNYTDIPSAVFTQPSVAVVGLSEEQALKEGYEIKIYKSEFRALKLTLTQSQERSYMKWVVCKKTDVLLGCHIVGENAGEILQGFAVAVKNKMTKAQIDQTIGIHPTSAEELVTMRQYL